MTLINFFDTKIDIPLFIILNTESKLINEIVNIIDFLFNLSEHVTVAFKSGFPVISIPLPSRRERCEFTLRPLSHTVRDFLQDLQAEDRGIERATVYNEDGSRISGGTGVDVLLQSNFKLVLNDDSYLVSVPDESKSNFTLHHQCPASCTHVLLGFEPLTFKTDRSLLLYRLSYMPRQKKAMGIEHLILQLLIMR